MNQVPDLKLEKLNQKLTNTELSILKYATGEDDKQIRVLIDAWRHLSALLNREISVRGRKQDDPALVYVPDPDVKQFIEAWCNRLKHTEIGTVSYRVTNFAT